MGRERSTKTFSSLVPDHIFTPGLMERAMDPEHANTIPISEILGKLDLKPLRCEGPILYYTPLWDRKRRSTLIVNRLTNRWSDAAISNGNLIEWVVQYLRFRGEAHTELDALRWIANMSVCLPEPIADPIDRQRIELRHKKTIQYPGLLHYLEREGIALSLARRYMKEIHARNRQTGKDFIALGLPTVEGGFALRTAYLERSIGLPTISFIRGRVPKPNGIHLFKEGFDFLSVLSYLNRTDLDEDVIILNTWSCLSQVPAYIRQYGYQTAYSWLNNTDLGQQATNSISQFLQTEIGTCHQPMNKLYKLHDNVHSWYRHTLRSAA
ncbi:hypothetical protein [Spirosoma foliorum]|uniref:Uncharacterized protein n=1 Tax=Spirosoma foliorum TaxID=2710596 RepID=A0A7G5H2W6_9BACT|nr:hypothetical protein [Spirosoma foliorum]QMW05458.1 hypothetical protein H3H32_11490 [Spirosoma foliorum]